MQLFAVYHPDLAIVPHTVAQLPWGHIALLIQSVKDNTIREWYIQKIVQNGWSRDILANYIRNDKLTQTIPEKFKNGLPTIEEIEAELNESSKY